MKARELYEKIRSDNMSGASAILDAIVSGMAELDEGELTEFIRLLPQTHPSMAPILNLWNRLDRALASGRDRDELIDTATVYLAEIQRSRDDVVAEAVKLIAPCERIITISRSSLVERALQQKAGRKPFELIVAESRPQREGIGLAEAMNQLEAVRVTLVVDAAAVFFVQDADCVVVGADAITPEWVVNKVGTYALALAAKHHGKPTFVLASIDKFTDERTSKMLTFVEHTPDEVLPNAPFRIKNIYFDRTPIEWVRIVSDRDGAR